MKQILAEIQSGAFAEEWMDEYHHGGKTFYATRQREQGQQIETVGKSLRKMMTFLNAKEVA
jgi:ketol-acid reductoisomerase